VIVDYGMGNLGSIQNMLKKVGSKALISSDKSVIESADKLILPGVGAFDHAIRNLKNLGLADVLDEKVLKEKTPILGICLGMQVITRKSEEGTMPGLGWLDAETLRFRFDGNTQLKIPHMGWNTIDVKQDAQLFRGMFPEPRFYFVHSFYVKCMDEKNVLATTRHGIDFASSVVKENIYGVQFHPEKSHKFGKKVLRNFVEMK
jgi:glutamine amidotransferase